MRQKAAALETELLAIEGMPYVGPYQAPEAPGLRPTFSLRVGDKGHFGPNTYTVTKVAAGGGNFAIVQIGEFDFMVSGIDTDKLAEGSANPPRGRVEGG